MSANPLLNTPALDTSYSSLSSSFILQGPNMTFTEVDGNGVDTQLALFTMVMYSFPKTMAFWVVGDFTLTDGVYTAGFGIAGPGIFCAPSSGNLFGSLCIDDWSGYLFATDNPNPEAYVNVYITNYPKFSSPGTIHFGVDLQLVNFSLSTIVGRITITSPNLHGVDSLTFP